MKIKIVLAITCMRTTSVLECTPDEWELLCYDIRSGTCAIVCACVCVGGGAKGSATMEVICK